MHASNTQKTLIRAVISGNYPDFTKLCAESSVSISEYITPTESWNLLHSCFISPHLCANIDIVNHATQLGVATNASDIYGNTPLYYAIRQGSLEGVQCLLESGANPNHQNSDGLSPLRYCFLQKPYHYEIVKQLLDSGANLENRIGQEGKNDYAFIKTVAFDHPDILTLIRTTKP